MPKVPEFDNLADVKSKFLNTICYYKKKPVFVKNCNYQTNPVDGEFIIGNKFQLTVGTTAGKNISIKLEDPDFNYKEYNLGYSNGTNFCVWWFRKPIKQYSQGLSQNQLHWSISVPGMVPEENFSFHQPFIAMLQNEYPSLNVVAGKLKDKKGKIMAFHKDFALSWDNLHEDFILEYRGKKVGVSVNGNIDEYRLMPEFKHLAEALQEAIA